MIKKKYPANKLNVGLLSSSDLQVTISVGQNLFRTSNLIGSCWPKLRALLFQSWGSFVVLFGIGLSNVF